MSVRKNLRKEFGQEWYEVSLQNKLRCCKENLFENNRVYEQLSRSESTALTRFRIGHTKATHDFLLRREQMPVCEVCNTVQHIILSCSIYDSQEYKLI